MGVEGLDSPAPTARGIERAGESVVAIGDAVLRERWGLRGLISWLGRALMRRHIRGNIFLRMSRFAGFFVKINHDWVVTLATPVDNLPVLPRKHRIHHRDTTQHKSSK